MEGPAEDLTGTAVEVLQEDYFSHFRLHYKGALMANLGFTRETGNAILEKGMADLVSFGVPFIANPDLVARFRHNHPLAESDRETYYSGGEKGYTDHPFISS